MNKKNIFISLTIFFIIIFVIGFFIPENLTIPVENGDPKDWNHETFWYEPWGESGVHKGIDIFAKKGTNLLSATGGIVIYTGVFSLGGKAIAVLGPKWRLHYYSHLDSILVNIGEFVSNSQIIGKVGDSGNAVGKPPHVHYSIVSVIPYLWRWDSSTQGYKKVFYLNPSDKLLGL